MTDFETKYRDLVAGLEALVIGWRRDAGGNVSSEADEVGRLLVRIASSPAEREGEGREVWRGGLGHVLPAARSVAPAPVSSGEAGEG